MCGNVRNGLSVISKMFSLVVETVLSTLLIRFYLCSSLYNSVEISPRKPSPTNGLVVSIILIILLLSSQAETPLIGSTPIGKRVDQS